MTYLHRNGENKAPEKDGWYWFNGLINDEYHTDGVEVVHLDSNGVELTGDNHGYYLETCVGQWWGPIPQPEVS